MKDARLATLEEAFKAFADPTRLRILGLLAGGEICVCNIHDAWAFRSPTASRHLAYLRKKKSGRDAKGRAVGALQARRARRAGHARADERRDARALALRRDRERSPAPRSADRMLRADASPTHLECCSCRPSAQREGGRQSSNRAPQRSPARAHLIFFHTTSGRIPQKPYKLNAVRHLRHFLRSSSIPRGKYISPAVSSPRFRIDLYRFANTRPPNHRLFQSLLKIGNTKCSVALSSANHNGRGQRVREGATTKSATYTTRQRPAISKKEIANRRGRSLGSFGSDGECRIRRGMRCGRRATSSSPCLNSCRRKDSRHFCRR